jgi:hypothetical protein
MACAFILGLQSGRGMMRRLRRGETGDAGTTAENRREIVDHCWRRLREIVRKLEIPSLFSPK